MVHRMLAAIAALVLRRPRSVLVAAALLTLLALYGARGVALLTDLGQLLPRQGEASSNLRAFLQRFGTGDRLMISISYPSGVPADIEVLDDTGGAVVERLQKSGLFHSISDRVEEDRIIQTWRFGLDHLPALIDVERLPDFEERLSSPGMRSALIRLRRSLLSPASFAAKLMARDDPLGLGQFLPRSSVQSIGGFGFDLSEGLFLSPDRTALLVLGQPVRSPLDFEFSRRLLDEVNAAIAAVETARRAKGAGSQLEYRVAGGYRQSLEDSTTMRHDLILTASVSLGGVLLLFLLVFRRLGVLLLVAAPLVMSACWTFGLASLFPGHLNVITVGFAAILFGLGDDSALHLYNHFAESASLGARVEDAVRG
ncbi:MAG: MMPL family transporter, partial [Acidobacteria bacterium]|nr:MMPL family transporter [Acidobacteriota bacterium]